MKNPILIFVSYTKNLNTSGLNHPLDPHSYPLYSFVALALLFDVVFYIFSRFSVENILFRYREYLIIALWPWFCGLIARRYGFPRVGATLEMLSLITVQGFITLVMIAFLASVSMPFADATLIRTDQILGFDWLKLFAFYQDKPNFTAISESAYSTLPTQLSFCILVLIATGNIKRGRQFVTAWAGASIITALVFPLFPAIGPYVFYDVTPQEIPGLLKTWPLEFGASIEDLRNGSNRNIDLNFTGLVQFPSFHTAAAILFAWALLPFRFLRWPAILLNAAMIFSTLIIGAHYLIDLIGGAVVAVVAIMCSKKMLGQTKSGGQSFPVFANDPLS